MTDTHTQTNASATHESPATAAKTATSRPRRDADAARRAAQDRVQAAQVILEAVDSYHAAADQLDAAADMTRKAGADRVDALRRLRAAGLSVTVVAELTGLSASRIQTLTKGD